MLSPLTPESFAKRTVRGSFTLVALFDSVVNGTLNPLFATVAIDDPEVEAAQSQRMPFLLGEC